MLHLFDGLTQGWLLNVVTSLRQYAIYAISLWVVLWVVLRAPLAARKIRERTPPAQQLLREFVLSLRSIAIFASINVLITVLDRLGVYPLPRVGAAWGPAWFWISLVLM